MTRTTTENTDTVAMTLRQRCQAQWIAPSQRMTAQLPRAVIVSVIAAGIDVGTLLCLVGLAHWPPLVAAILSYLLGGVVQYVLCACWVFPHAPTSVAVGFVMFSLLSLVGLGITAATMSFLGDRCKIDYRVAKCVALGLTFCWNFCSRKYWLFRTQ